jgi:hypothetical protein
MSRVRTLWLIMYIDVGVEPGHEVPDSFYAGLVL